MGFVISILVFVFAMASGFVAGHVASPPSDIDLSAHLAKEGRTPSSLNFALSSIVVDDKDAVLAAPLDDGASAIEMAIDQIELSDSEARLAKAIGDDPLSIKLRRALIAPKHEDLIPNHHELGVKYLEDFRKTPAESIKMMTRALSVMPAEEFPMERASLIMVATTLPGQQTEAQQLALTELTTTIIEPVKDARNAESNDLMVKHSQLMSIPITAHMAFLRTSSDATMALSGTVEGIVAQPDLGLRFRLANQFISKFPSMEEELKITLARRGIQLPSPQQNSESEDAGETHAN